MKILSRKAAKTAGKTHYFTGRPCSKGHVAIRRVSNSSCSVCELETSKRTRNPDTKRAYDKQYHKKNSKRFYDYEKAYGRYAHYRARLKQAIPSWYENEQSEIRALYRQRKHVTEETGVVHHVDHIVPLCNNFVCGLHCLANLQLLTEEENRHKSNRFTVDY